MLNTPFPPWPSFTEEEVAAVARVLRSGRVNAWTGDECNAFEQEFATFAGTEHAVCVANGTLALELALQGLGVGAGDEVIVTPRSFIASVSAVVNSGATPIFADIEPETQNLSATTIEPHISSRTRAVICVHLAGMPCDLDPIMDLAQHHGFFVIEDCAQAHGATYRNRPVGGIGHVGAWSFCQDKIMTTGGEGGMVTTSDKQLWSRMWSLKDHGKSYETVHSQKHPPGFRWLHEDFGSNFRMTEMQAAIGRVQLGYMPRWNETRRSHAATIWQKANALPGLHAPEIPSWAGHAAYKAYVFVVADELIPGWTRDKIMNEISNSGVPCYSGSCSEIYREKAFDGTGWRPAEPLAIASALGDSSLMFLVHPTLTSEHIARTCEVLADVMSTAGRKS